MKRRARMQRIDEGVANYLSEFSFYINPSKLGGKEQKPAALVFLPTWQSLIQ